MELVKDSFAFELKEYIEKYSKFEIYEKNSIISDYEESLNKVFIIINGRVKITRISEETGREQIIHLLSKGDMYDVVSIIEDIETDNIAVALDKVYLISIPRNRIKELIESKKEFNQYVLKYLAQKIRKLENLSADLSLLDTTQRLIKLIVENINPENPLGRLEGISDLSNEEIAALIGSVRKVVNRDIQKLKEEGLIETSRKNIFIKDNKKLLESHF